MRRDAWQALADPTRRKIIELLIVGDQTINEIANEFDISRPGVSKQIKILAESGLVQIETIGRERYCSLTLGPLEEVYLWVSQYEKFWNQKLDKLDKYLNKKKSK